MIRIKRLPEEIKTQIAAGQVIENPASVVKELVENALDAAATTIDIHLENGGITSVTVIDTGAGMYPEELALAIAPNSTSKITSAEDLAAIRSYGFRGEALASMAIVADVTVASRIPDRSLGFVLKVHAGVQSPLATVGMPVGTAVTVENLFSSVPARKKYLKTERTEVRKVLAALSPFLLAFPTVSFSLTHNKKDVFNLSSQSIEARIAAVLEISQQKLFEIDFSDAHYAVKGYIGAPQLAHKGTQRQFLYVNGRPVQRTDLSSVVKESFGTLLEPRTFPVFVLDIVAPPEMVDVNVSPKKDTVHFYNEAAIKKMLFTAVQQTIESADLHYASHGRGIDSLLRENTMEEVTAGVLKAEVDPWSVKNFSLNAEAEILQVHALYLIAQTSHGIVIIDQHAAHERILYQQFLEAFEKKKTAQQKKLKKQVVFALPLEDYEALKENEQTLVRMGFSVTFTKRKVTVTATPELFVGRDLQQLFSEFAADCREDRPIAELDSVTHRTLAFLACRTAIKAGEKLTQKERRRLLEKLFATKTQFTCPHGRPVYIDLEMNDLHRLFKRIQ